MSVLAFLGCKDTPGNRYVVLQCYRGILDDADTVTVSLQNLVNPLPVCVVYEEPWTRTMLFMLPASFPNKNVRVAALDKWWQLCFT